jgi:hypothetical protein
MENNYNLPFDNELNEPSIACIETILAYSKSVQSFQYNEIRFKINLN